MEADILLQSIETLLRVKVEAAGGILDVADNPWDVQGLLQVSPAKWRVVLSWDDEQSIEDQCRGGWTLGTLSVFVQAHRGMEAKPGLTIHRPTPAERTSLTRRVAQVRRWIRSIQFDQQDIAKDDFSHITFIRAQWIDSDNKEKPWRCRRLDFDIAFALDDPAADLPPDTGLQISGVTEDGGYYLVALNDVLVAKMPRHNVEDDDEGDASTGFHLSALSGDGGFYIVTLDGVPHGRVPAFSAD